MMPHTMMRHFFMISVLVALGASGCARSTSGPLAVALPLEEIKTPPVYTSPVDSPTLSMDDNTVTVVGTNGDALNAATRLHRHLQAMQVQSEIQVVFQTRSRSKLAITFRESLSPTQQQMLRELVAAIQKYSPRT
jgi:hypothetical protein